MNKIVVCIFSGVLWIFVNSCEKVIDIDIEEAEPMLVLNSAITPDSLVMVSVTKSLHILDNASISPVTDAVVNIYQGGDLLETLNMGEDRIYRSHFFKPNYDVEYTISAEAVAFNTAVSSCRIPYPVPIYSLDTSSSVNEWGEQVTDFNLKFEDDPDTDNFYRIRLFQKSAWLSYEYIEVYDTLYVDPVRDTVIMGWIIDTVETRVPFFETYFFNSEDLIIEEYVNSDNSVIFSDQYIKGEEYSFHGEIYFYPYGQDTTTIYFYFESLTEDYFNYLKTRERHFYSKDDPFSVPVIVYNNISGGLGIFGGYSVYVDSVKIAPFIWDEEIYREY